MTSIMIDDFFIKVLPNLIMYVCKQIRQNLSVDLISDGNNNLVLILSNLFLMKQKRTKYTENQQYPGHDQSMQSPSQPVKSPSPDKKRSKLITPTKSPQLIDIKRNLVQSRLQDRKGQRTPIATKPHQQSTRYYTNEDFQQYRSSHKKNQILQQLQNMLPEQFNMDSSHMYRSANNPNSKQLDYIKLLQEKEKTIKELHEIIEMINRNNSLELSSSSVSNTKHKRIFDNSGILSKSPGGQTPEKQLKNQVRILTIENQQLIHMIEKLNQNKKSYENLQKSLIKQKIDYTSHRMKEEILSRQIYQMKQSLMQKDQDCNALMKENKDLYSKYLKLDQQNQKLIKMMKDKELSDRKYHSSLIESNISQKSSISQSQVKEKVSIHKIKEQYNQSLKVFKDTVYGDVEEFMRQIQSNTKGLANRINQLEDQVKTLEKFKSAYENLQRAKCVGKTQSGNGKDSNNKEQEFKNDLHDISEIKVVSPQKGHFKEIESLLMEKNQLYERELSTQRKNNQQLTQQLENLRSRYQTIYSKYSQLMEHKQKPQQNPMNQQSLRVSRSPRKSPQRNIQIQEINQAKARQAQIQKLCELIQKCQRQFSEQKSKFLKEIQLLQRKNQSYEQIIQCQRQQFEEKQNDVKTRISDKQNQLKRNQSIYKSQIDHLKQLLSEKSIHQQPEHLSELQQLKQSLQLKQLQIQHMSTRIVELNQELQQKQTQINQYKQKLQHLEETQQFAKEEIKKLVENYQTEINILKSDKLVQKQKHQRQLQQKERQLQQKERQLQQKERQLQQKERQVQRLQELVDETKKQVQNCQQQISHQNSEIKRLINQSQNSQLLLSNTQTQSRLQMSKLNQKLQSLQRQLNHKNRESRQLLHSKQALQVQHSQLKEHIEQLLVISSHVEDIQRDNKDMRQTIIQYETRFKTINQANLNLSNQLNHLQQQKQALINDLNNLQQQKQALTDNLNKADELNQTQQSTINQLQLTITQLKSTIRQLQQQVNMFKSRLSQVRKQSQDIVRQNQGIKQQHLDILTQNQSILKQTQLKINQKNIQLMEQTQKFLHQKLQYEFLIKQLKQDNSNLNADLQLLRQDNLLYHQSHNQLLHLKQNNPLPQLYQLRSLLNTQFNQTLTAQTHDKQTHYDLGKLHIDYQAQIDLNLLLHTKIDELNNQTHKSLQEKLLLQEKIHFLQKNILIYQNQLKERKSFCQKLIQDNNKLDKQLLLIKKLKLQSRHTQNQSRHSQNDTMRLSLLERVNNLVKIEQSRDNTIKRISQKRTQSPIRQINSLISKVQQFDAFSIKPYQNQ